LDTFFAKPTGVDTQPVHGEGDVGEKRKTVVVEQSFGSVGKRSILPLSTTVPAVLFFAALNAPLLTQTGRSLYWKSAVFGTLFCWAWIAVRS
jgi:hypothetical protein